MYSWFEFIGWCTKSKEPILPYNLSIAVWRTNGFMPFSKALAQSEMQTASSRLWTLVYVSISYDENLYDTGASTVWNFNNSSQSEIQFCLSMFAKLFFC